MRPPTKASISNGELIHGRDAFGRNYLYLVILDYFVYSFPGSALHEFYCNSHFLSIFSF